MSEDKQADNDPERTLLTLDQLSQTIEVMTSVVNRLRQHLSEQMRAQAAAKDAAAKRALEESAAAQNTSAGTLSSAEKLALEQSGKKASSAATSKANKNSFIVEIKQADNEPDPKSTKTLH